MILKAQYNSQPQPKRAIALLLRPIYSHVCICICPFLMLSVQCPLIPSIFSILAIVMCLQIDRAFEASKVFFELDQETKVKYRKDVTDGNSGYLELNREM